MAKDQQAMKEAAQRMLGMLGDMQISDIKAVTIHTNPPAEAPIEEEVFEEEEEVVEEVPEKAPRRKRPRPEDLFEEEEEEEVK